MEIVTKIPRISSQSDSQPRIDKIFKTTSIETRGESTNISEDDTTYNLDSDSYSDSIPKVIRDKENQHENSSSASGECHRGILKGRNVSQKKL